MINWYAAHTHAQSEDKALWHLSNQGFNVFLPKYLKSRRHARKTTLIKAPLFPRYLFVEIDMNRHLWHAINSTIGINHLVCSGTTPSPVPSYIIDELRSREDAHGLISLDFHNNLKKGDSVRILNGPFSDVIGLFECAADNERIMILLNILGRPVQVKIQPQFVEALT